MTAIKNITLNNVSEGRKLWIDQLRGIAMLLVIIGHNFPGWTAYFVLTSPIKIPMFFSLSGYLFNDRQGDLKHFFFSLCKNIIIPWIILSLLPLKLIKALVIDQSLFVAGQYLYTFVAGKSLWYMPCCIIAEIIWFFILKCSRNNRALIICISALIAIFGYIMSLNGILSFAKINTACIAQVFLCLGFLIKRSEFALNKHLKIVLSLCAIAYFAMAALTFWLYPGQNLDVNRNYYYNIFICAIIIIAGCVFLFAASPKLNKTSRILVFVGQNTLVFYMLYSYCQRAVEFCLDRLFPDNIASVWIFIVVSCLLCAVVAIFLNKFFPIFVGKRRRKNA